MKAKDLMRKLELLMIQHGEDIEVDIHFYIEKRGKGFVPHEEPMENITVLAGKVVIEN